MENAPQQGSKAELVIASFLYRPRSVEELAADLAIAKGTVRQSLDRWIPDWIDTLAAS